MLFYLEHSTTANSYPLPFCRLVCVIVLQLVGLYGPEASKHLFRCLVSCVDFTSDGRSCKDGQQLQMLCQEANALISKPNFVSILCHGFEKQENKVRKITLKCLQNISLYYKYRVASLLTLQHSKYLINIFNQGFVGKILIYILNLAFVHCIQVVCCLWL